VAASAFGALVLPRLADGEIPGSLKPPATTPSMVQQKLQDGRCPHRGLHYPGT